MIATTGRALCKIAGRLVIAEFGRAENGQGHCPLCHGNRFFDDHGWATCEECGRFAILASDLQRLEESL